MGRRNRNISYRLSLGDVGAIFACVAAGQAISGFATPLYNKIYVAVNDKTIFGFLTLLYYHVLDVKYATIKLSSLWSCRTA